MRPSLQILINSDGVEMIRFMASSWEEETSLRDIYDRIKPLIREIDASVKPQEPRSLPIVGDGATGRPKGYKSC
jgi:hypothetical protein